MQKFIGVLLLSLIATSALAAQDQSVPAATSQAEGTRYEVVQSPLAEKWTFKLDRFTGRVWQLVLASTDDFVWELMTVRGLGTSSSNAPRFQIFTSSIAVKYIFLIDTELGRTWVLVGSPKRWVPFAE